MRTRWWAPTVLFVGLGLITYAKGTLDAPLMLIGGGLSLIGSLACSVFLDSAQKFT